MEINQEYLATLMMLLSIIIPVLVVLLIGAAIADWWEREK